MTASSWNSSCRHSPVDLDPEPRTSTEDRDVLRQRARNGAAAASIEMLNCAREQNGSDVLGALGRIAQTLRETRDDTGGDMVVLAVSDFEQTDPEFRISKEPLTTKAERKKAVDKLLTGRKLPALKGMDLYTVGYGKNPTRKPSTYEGFDQFWTEILSDTGEGTCPSRRRVIIPTSPPRGVPWRTAHGVAGTARGAGSSRRSAGSPAPTYGARPWS
ncbi:hypothetical protein ACRJ4W_29825 [Streptomyces sp. GLT-R25]